MKEATLSSMNENGYTIRVNSEEDDINYLEATKQNYSNRFELKIKYEKLAKHRFSFYPSLKLDKSNKYPPCVEFFNHLNANEPKMKYVLHPDSQTLSFTTSWVLPDCESNDEDSYMMLKLWTLVLENLVTIASLLEEVEDESMGIDELQKRYKAMSKTGKNNLLKGETVFEGNQHTKKTLRIIRFQNSQEGPTTD